MHNAAEEEFPKAKVTVYDYSPRAPVNIFIQLYCGLIVECGLFEYFVLYYVSIIKYLFYSIDITNLFPSWCIFFLLVFTLNKQGKFH